MTSLLRSVTAHQADSLQKKVYTPSKKVQKVDSTPWERGTASDVIGFLSHVACQMQCYLFHIFAAQDLIVIIYQISRQRWLDLNDGAA